MKSKPLVSVIIIFFKAEKFIEEAIESVFVQTYDNWELVLVDDGSSDGSTEIALRFAEQYPGKVFYVEHLGHQNRGMSASRNMGIKNAKGEFIAFLDADDVWLPHKLEGQVAVLESQPEAAMVYGPAHFWHSWTGNVEHSRRDFMQELGVQLDTLVKPPTLLTLFLRNEGVAPCTCSFLIRREVMASIGGFEETFRGMYEDQAFLAKVCLGVSVFVESEYGCRVRVHPDSCCSIGAEAGQLHSARLAFFNWLEEYLLGQSVKDREVWRALREVLWPYRHPHLHELLTHAREREWQMLLKWSARQTLPAPVQRWLRAQRERVRPRPPVELE